MGVRSVVQRQRERALASDQRAGRWARAKARRLQREYVRRNWRILSAVGGGLLGFIAVQVPLFPRGFARGLYLGSFSTAVVGLLAFWVVQATGTASTMMGDEAEQRTAQELRKLRNRGWKLINHVSLQGRDIDHVLLGPGGVFGVETKWTADSWAVAPDDPRVVAACGQVSRNTKTLRSWLRNLGVSSVEPVIFLWGAGARDLPPVQTLRRGDQEVSIVAGPQSEAWLTSVPTGRLDDKQLARAWDRLEAYCETRDPREALENPLPLSVAEFAMRFFLGLATAAAALLLTATWLATGPSSRWWLPALIVLALPGLGLLRFARAVRYIAWGWLWGVGISVLLIIYVMARWAIEHQV
jgi:hypothetical protein